VSSSLRRGALAAATIAFSIASLAACGAGNDAQTLEVKPDNAAVSVGTIKVQNALVITQPLTESGSEAAGPAVISATLFNSDIRHAQTLDSITVDGVGTAKLTPAKGKGKLEIPAGGSLVLGGKGNASAALTDPAGITDGNAQKVTFTLSRTGGVSLSAFVVPADSYFTKWGPTSIPSTPAAGSTATGSASPKPGKSTSATPTDAASASATATETGTTTG
jgi:hypothetical protein